MNKAIEKIQNSIDDFKKKNPDESVGELSDSYHSFNDLYKHRTLLLALSLLRMKYAWKSKTHEDGTMYDGMFVVGAPLPDGMISYHCDNEYWNLFKIPTLPHAPHFDGYDEKDVLDRIHNYIMKYPDSVHDNRIEDIVENEILPVFDNDIIGQARFVGFYNKLL